MLNAIVIPIVDMQVNNALLTLTALAVVVLFWVLAAMKARG